jgi:hypothetical protein
VCRTGESQEADQSPGRRRSLMAPLCAAARSFPLAEGCVTWISVHPEFPVMLRPLNRHSRLAGLLFFLVLVVAVQVVEHLYRWYVHRDERAQLAVLREELIDVGAEMIEAQLAIEHIRAEMQMLDSEGERWRVRAYPHGSPHPATPAPRRTARPDGEEHGRIQARILERNRQLDDLSVVVSRRNSAAARYYLLADSLRSVADRVRDPYFAIPLPAEAATARGITATGPPPGAARSHSAYGSATQRRQPGGPQAHN